MEFGESIVAFELHIIITTCGESVQEGGTCN
jgi:hypothetical protein